ncbi:MAG: serine/threonine-protein kinase [bacterium]|nr:serine/threonine-protein kinase [bacterium]
MAQAPEHDGRGPDADDVPQIRFDPIATARRTRQDLVRGPIKLGRYTLLDRIGRGGFGVVYRALDPLLNREVASKLLRSRPNVKGGAEALIHEARMTAQLQHPHVVRIFDVGRVQGDWSAYGADVFIIMELLDGMPLSRWLRQEERTDREIVEMFLQTADGLAAAHQQGIVHCDVKPGNVFVTEAGEAKVLDFGLSRHSSQRARTTLTPGAPPSETAKHRVVAGTRPYMAPEAHAGREPDAAADQYSFGLALIEALAGALPFKHRGKGKLVGKKLEGVPPEWLKHNDVARGLIPIVLRATAPDPAHRYPGMDSLADDLRRWLDPAAAGRWVGVAAGSVVAVAAVAWVTRAEPPCEIDPGAAAQSWSEARPTIEARWPDEPTGTRARFEEQLSTYVDDWTEAAGAACQPDVVSSVPTDEARSCLRERLGRVEAVLSIVESADTEVFKRLPELASQFVSPSYCLDAERTHELPPVPDAPADREDVAEIRDVLSLARAHHAAGNYGEGLRLAKLGLVRSTGGFEPVRAEAMYETGVLAVSTGDLEGGAEYIEQAYLAAEGRKHDRLAAAAAVRLVSIYGRHLVQRERAREWARRSEVAIERLTDTTKHRAALEYNLGLLEHAEGSLDLARDHFQAALVLYEERGDVRDARVCRMSLGVIEEMKGESETALALFKEAFSGARTSLGLEHPDTATALAAVAGAQTSLGQLQVARENLESALGVFERTHGPEHHTVASTLSNVGTVAFDLGDYDQALIHHERALAIYEETLPEGHPRTATTIGNIADAHSAKGAHEVARDGYARALDMLRERLDPQSPQLAHVHANLGLALAKLERYEESAAQFDKAWTIVRSSTSEADRAFVLYRRALARRHAGQRPLDDVRRALSGFEQGRSMPRIAEAKFELAKLLVQEDGPRALEEAREALTTFRSMGADRRADPVQTWIDEHE